MSKTVGIIPAGGQAVRFGGMAKELLPISKTECGLSRCITSMLQGGADEVFIITDRRDLTPYATAIYKPSIGLWDAFITAANIAADWYYFAMPDTVYPIDAFSVYKTNPVMVGTFITDKPERFGMLRDGQIVDKQPGKAGLAWGMWILDNISMDYLAMLAGQTHDHTAALNALLKLEYVEFPLSYYYDFATFEDYKEFLCSQV